MMAIKGNPGENRARSSISLFIIVAGLCCFFYLLGVWQRSGFGRGDWLAHEMTKKADGCGILFNLEIESHQIDKADESIKQFEACDERYVDYTPCQYKMRAMNYPRENMMYWERHCPLEEEKLHCLVPAPKGYVTPFPWPKSRDYVPYANAPHKSLTDEKAVQNWVKYEGNVFRFPQGIDAYIEQLASVIPIDNGTIRTALDTGCGVASWGAYLFKKNVITMSFAPRDLQVQFALERGVPAVIGVLGTIKLPYPSRAFDMVHCSCCFIPWSANGGMYMMEVDRVLRPGGYWILSGPPIDWKNNPKEELEEEQRKIEDIAKLLCWEKKHEMGEIAIWRKGKNCERDSRITMCESASADDVWYKKMEACVTPYIESTNVDEVAGGELKPFPERLNAVPPRAASGSSPRISAELFMEDNKLWRKHVNAYKRVNKILDKGRYRNIMDMNAGLGSFAAALESSKLWVMNVVPTIGDRDTLGVIYERGLIGIYHDWCEAFSTYPRTYDLIHANGLFSLYKDKCSAEDILLEMERILRPEGAVIFRDHEDILTKVRKIATAMRWNTKMVDHEDGPLITEKVLFAVKQYWVVGEKENNSILSR